jgi:hypothetical protein
MGGSQGGAVGLKLEIWNLKIERVSKPEKEQTMVGI